MRVGTPDIGVAVGQCKVEDRPPTAIHLPGTLIPRTRGKGLPVWEPDHRREQTHGLIHKHQRVIAKIYGWELALVRIV